MLPHLEFKFQSIDDLIATVTPNCYIGLIDLEDAYRHVQIHPEDREVQSFKLGGKYYLDLFMSFGLSIAPATFNRMTKSNQRHCGSDVPSTGCSLLGRICGNWEEESRLRSYADDSNQYSGGSRVSDKLVKVSGGGDDSEVLGL